MRERAEGWEARLAAKLSDVAARRYAEHTWNCAIFAHVCAQAVAGRQLPMSWKGSLEASADALFPRVAPLLACRGDIVLAHVPEPSLGVCIGREAIFVSKDGLLTRWMREARIAWSV